MTDKTKYSVYDHAFVICAYKENKYLYECISSLLAQHCKSDIYMSTSTPNKFIFDICTQYHIPVFTNTDEKGIASDWNFCMNIFPIKKLITIVHQDDVYEPEYLEKIIEFANKANNPLIIYTDYYEIRNGKKNSNWLLTIKRVMNFPLRFSVFQKSIKTRRFILSFGCPICCPSVTYVKTNLPIPLFDTRFKNSCDYKAWEVLSREGGGVKGEFVYCPQKLVGHRIYEDSATSTNIKDNSRKKEDMEILCEFWPKFFAKFIFYFYKHAEKSNRLSFNDI